MKMLAMRLAMPLLGVLLWVLSIHAGTFATATLVSSPISGFDDSNFVQIRKSRYSIKSDTVPDLGIVITEKDLNRSVTFANGVVNYMKRLETNLGWSDITVRHGTPAHGMYISFSPEREAVDGARDALVALKASVQLLNSFCNKHDLKTQDCAKYLTTFKYNKTPLKSSCAQLKKRCSPEEYLSAYRSMDGSCNHVLSGRLGESFTGYTRLIYPDYLDGIYEPRRAVNKKALPNARFVSSRLVKPTEKLNDRLTLAVMQWGQFVAHDLSRPATAIMIHTEKSIDCCSPEGNNLSPRYIHPFCAPVSVPEGDQRYSDQGVDCINYVRSLPALRSDCSFGPTDQVNQATHYLDGSQIYGSTARRSSSLRSFNQGKLEVTSLNGKHYLPVSQIPTEDCQWSSPNTSCFKSGDPRVNFQPQLTAMHTIWYREHNRIANKLAALNSQWDDETLFQETRRIVIAEMQHITYRGWLNSILARKLVNRISNVSTYDEDEENVGTYDEDEDSGVSNSFATAAIRAMISLYDGRIKLFEEDRVRNDSISLRDHFNKPSIIQKPGALDALVRGLATQNTRRLGMHYVEDLTNKLYADEHFGYDVLSLDIQRGRDHGLPDYTKFRALCGFEMANKFTDFKDVMTEEEIIELSKVYSSPADVDLMVGGLLEKPDEGSLLGPTFSCIIADQFMRSKKGDRYFYTNAQQPRPFAASQLREIKKVTLARIFCDNADDIKMMQPNVFEKISPSNSLVSCDDIPRMSLVPWRDSREIYS